MTDILISSGGGGGSELDEREVAAAALDAAEEQLQSLCASHAGTFVSVERRGRALEASLQELLAAIKKSESQIATAQHSLEQDDDEENEMSLAVLSEKHRVRRRTLLQHSSLLELLELPSLIDACVRSNLYDEALSIASFSNTLERRHKENNQVVTTVIAQVRSRQTDLRRHLLHRLKSPVTMPECLEVVTALRRLNSIDLERQSEVNLERVHAAMELRLQIDFLEARDVWLQSTGVASTMGMASPGNTAGSAATRASLVQQTHASEPLLDAIERYRTRVFEVATQFNAIFRTQTTKTSESLVQLLSIWTARKVQSFLDLLAARLDLMEDAASLRDALEASVFFANSMGRLGGDFTAQLPKQFEPKMHELVVSFWKNGSQQLDDTLKICREAGTAVPLTSLVGGGEEEEEEEPEPTPAASTDASGDYGLPQPPPRQLMSVPPLARLVNAHLAGLNELRRCLLPGIFSLLRQSLEEELVSIKAVLQANEKVVMTPGFRKDAAALRAAALQYQQIFSDLVQPYLCGSLEAALGNVAAAASHYQVLRDNQRTPDKEDDNLQEGEGTESNEAGDGDGDIEEIEQGAENKESSTDA